PDMRVRQEAQFALVARGPVAAATTFTNIVRRSTNRFARLHAVWGLGQVAKRSGLAVSELGRLLEDDDAEVRAQAAKVLGDAHLGNSNQLASLLGDESPRVRYFAAMALAHVGNRETLGSVLNLLRANDDRDVYLRHAGVMAMAGLLRRANVDPAAK